MNYGARTHLLYNSLISGLAGSACESSSVGYYVLLLFLIFFFFNDSCQTDYPPKSA